MSDEQLDEMTRHLIDLVARDASFDEIKAWLREQVAQLQAENAKLHADLETERHETNKQMANLMEANGELGELDREIQRLQAEQKQILDLVIPYIPPLQLPYQDSVPQAVQTALRALQAELDAARKWSRAWKAEVKQLTHTALCVYCGDLIPREIQSLTEHMLICEKRPERKLLEGLSKAVVDINHAEAERDAALKEVEDWKQSYAEIG